MTPIAPAGVRPLVRTRPKATAPLIPRPAARAIGALAKTPIAIDMTPATSAVAAASRRDGDSRVRQDQRVHEEDVAHDHERGHTGLDLGREVCAAFLELEEIR